MHGPMRTLCILGLAAATGCVSTDKYEKKAKEASDADARATACESKAAALEQKLQQTQQEMTAVQQDRDQLSAKAAALAQEKGQLEAKSAQLEAKSSQYEKLAGSLSQQIQAGQIEISELRDKMIVKLRDRILFPSGSASLSKEGKTALDAVADAFKGLQGKSVVVAGYTDDVPVAKGGAYKDNWDLSTARAVSVVRYLASKGVEPRMLGAAGFGEFRPMVANDSPANRSQNRRIEIALAPSDYIPPEAKAP